MLKAVIVDDEPDGIANLSFYLQKTGDIHILESISDTATAIQYLNTHEIDILFLDIHLKDCNGFDLLRKLQNLNFSLVFVTAYDRYAIQAFKVNAIDYILKPIDEEELQSVIAKIKRYRARQFSQENTCTTSGIPYIHVREQGENIKILLQQILYIEALGSYCKLFFLSDHIVKCLIVSKPIAQLESLVGNDHFFRTHKSYLANIQYFRKVENGTFSKVMLLEHNCSVMISRRKLKELRSVLDTIPVKTH